MCESISGLNVFDAICNIWQQPYSRSITDKASPTHHRHITDTSPTHHRHITDIFQTSDRHFGPTSCTLKIFLKYYQINPILIRLLCFRGCSVTLNVIIDKLSPTQYHRHIITDTTSLTRLHQHCITVTASLIDIR